MSYGPTQVFTTTIASAATISTFIDLGTKSYTKFLVTVASMSTNAELTLFGSPSSAAALFQPIQERVNTAPVQYQAVLITTASSGNWLTIDGVPVRYVKFLASATVTGGGTINLIAQD